MSREYGDTVRERTYPAVVADPGCSRRMHSDRTGESKRRTGGHWLSRFWDS
jgi:hypothetical protein